nr:MAG TPA: leucine-rich repeat protein [Crassvirales sp.]
MNKCLITKLNGSSNNSKILRLGELRIGISKIDSPNRNTQCLDIIVNEETTLEIVGDGYLTEASLEANNGKKKTLNPNIHNYVYVSNGNFEVAILNKYALVQFTDYDSNNMGDSAYPVKNKSLSDISIFKYCKALAYLNLSNTQVSGDISNLNTLTDLTYLSLSNTQVSGDISNLNTLTALTELYLYNTQVSGDISNLNTLTALTELYIHNTQVPITGDIGKLSTLTKLTKIFCQYSKLTGDLALLPASCYYISFMEDKGSAFTWSTRPTSAKILSIAGPVSLSNIDKMLQDQAQCQVGVPQGYPSWYNIISVAGNRTSASDAAIQTLQSKGYTVTVTPA